MVQTHDVVRWSDKRDPFRSLLRGPFGRAKILVILGIRIMIIVSSNRWKQPIYTLELLEGRLSRLHHALKIINITFVYSVWSKGYNSTLSW
jgi:hypothetical protein